MFEGFKHAQIQTSDPEVKINLRYGGSGPPVLLLHILKKLTAMGIGKGGFSKETLAEYARCCTPENFHAVCEDYRANMGVDMDMDTADFEAGRKIECPVAVFWGELSHTEKFFDPRKAWPPYATNIVRMQPLPCGHYPAEQVPDDTYEELHRFFS